SGGQMQRVAIASVIAMKPDVLILDEPTSQLDPKGSEEVFKVVERLAEEGMTIMMAEHKMEKIDEYADKVLLMDHGELIDFNTPDYVFSMTDLNDYSVTAPNLTRVDKKIGLKNKQIGLYPVRMSQHNKENSVMPHE